MSKVCGIIEILKIEFFNFSGSERVNYSCLQILLQDQKGRKKIISHILEILISHFNISQKVKKATLAK